MAETIIGRNPNIVSGRAYYYNITVLDALGQAINADANPVLSCYKDDSVTTTFQITMSKRGSETGRYFVSRTIGAEFEMGAEYLFVVKAVVGTVPIESSETIRFEDTKKLDYIYSKETRRP